MANRAPIFARETERSMQRKLNRLALEVDKSQPVFLGNRSNQAAITFQLTKLEVVSLDNANSQLVCKFPGTDGTVTTIVDLPDIFTETSRGGITYVYSDLNNRTANGTETQQITPEFIVGEVIQVAEFQAQNTTEFVGDGRMWAKTGP